MVEKKVDPEEVLSEEMVKAAKASAKVATAAKEEQTSGTGKLRRRGNTVRQDLQPSEIPYPAEIHGEDFEDYSSAGFGAVIPPGTAIEPYSMDQEFIIDPEKVKTLWFDRPGRNLPKKRLYTIKGLHKDGRLNQFPFEAQIQNNAGGDPEDAIGLRRYQRKGITLLIDWPTLRPVYCAAWDCWAQAAQEGAFVGFCSEKHAKHTLPNRYKNAGTILAGIFGEDATTTSTWQL